MGMIQDHNILPCYNLIEAFLSPSPWTLGSEVEISTAFANHSIKVWTELKHKFCVVCVIVGNLTNN